MRNSSPAASLGLRLLRAAGGLFLFALGIYTQLAAGIGVAPWNVLNDGLAQVLHMSFGNASILISLTIVLLDLFLGEPVGFGTLMDVFLIGWWVDWLVWLDFIPPPASLAGQLLVLVPGVFLVCFGQFLYMGAGLSCGPRDALLVAVGKRLPRIPIGMVNLGLMALALLAGWLMGGVTGAGTLVTMFCTGFCMDLCFPCCILSPVSSTRRAWLKLFQF